MISKHDLISHRDSVFHIETPEHFDAIGSPVRLSIIEFFRSRGPMPVAELAQVMGRPADGLYHHLKKLLAIGIVREVGTQQTGRQIERVFDIAANRLQVAEDTERLVKVWRLISSHAERNLASAIDTGGLRFRGDDPNVSMRVETARLDATARAEVFEHLNAIRAVFDRARAAPSGDQASFTFMFTPTVSSTDRSENARVSQRTQKKTRSQRKATGTNTMNAEAPQAGSTGRSRRTPSS